MRLIDLHHIPVAGSPVEGAGRRGHPLEAQTREEERIQAVVHLEVGRVLAAEEHHCNPGERMLGGHHSLLETAGAELVGRAAG